MPCVSYARGTPVPGFTYARGTPAPTERELFLLREVPLYQVKGGYFYARGTPVPGESGHEGGLLVRGVSSICTESNGGPRGWGLFFMRQVPLYSLYRGTCVQGAPVLIVYTLNVPGESGHEGGLLVRGARRRRQTPTLLTLHPTPYPES